MLKNRYVIGAIALLLVCFAAVVYILPIFQTEESESKAVYAASVFQEDKVTNVDITLNDSDFDSILENPTDEEIVDANVTINGKTLEHVGFRAKGNLSLRSVAAMEDSDRYSWKIDFDYYKDNQNLDGLKKLALNNNYSDVSMEREYLSYELMEELGIPTPSHSYMYVTINGKEWGLYLGVEALEETFLAQNYETGDGDLYKPDGAGSDLQWISDDISDYTGLNLKTNTDTSDQSAMINMLDVINNGGDLEEVLDVDEMLRYFAANTALVNLDHYQGNMKHNFYLYEEDGVFSLVPWDYNMAFGGMGAGMGGGRNQDPAKENGPNNGKTDSAEQQAVQGKAQKQQAAGNEQAAQAKGGMPDIQDGGMDMGSSSFLDEDSINFSVTTPVSGTTLEERPLLNVLLENDEYREKYNEYLEQIADGFFSEDTFKEKVDKITELITPYVKKDPTKFYTTAEFIEATSGDDSIIEFTKQRAESIKKQLSGELVVEAETGSNMPGQAEDGENKTDKQKQNGNNNEQNGQAQNGDGGNQPNGQGGQPPDMGNGQAPPDVSGGRGGPPDMNGGQGRPPNMDGQGGVPGVDGQNGPAGSSYSKENLIMTGISVVVLIAALIFAFRFKRRK